MHPLSVNFEEALQWLYSVQIFGIKPGLDNTRRLLKLLQLPGTGQKFLHVAGTNGKGSTCAFMDSVLRAGGRRVGLFTSPHLIQYTERIRVNGEMIPEDIAASGIDALRTVAGGMEIHPTFFELTLALALDWFDRADAEWVVLETGMGGRLDATNVVRPAACVITPVDMDHRQWLGNTLEAIAGEKAGILKPGVPAVSAPQHPDVERVLRETADRVGAPLRFVTEPVTDYPLSLPGQHQQWNAALALAALEAAGVSPRPSEIRAGLAETKWPGRFQELDGGRLVLDGAHNPHGVKGLVDTWRARFPGEKADLVFGAVAEKESGASLEMLAPIVARARFVTVDSPRAESAETLAARWAEIAPHTPAEIFPSLEEALKESEGRTLVCGSLYLCGQVLALRGGNVFERSAQ